jgi:GNAT superfamily N-acetyltransferase
MHQLAHQMTLIPIQKQPVRKKILEDHDLQVVTNLIYAGLRQGLYTELFKERARSEILSLVRRLVSRCELHAYDAAQLRFRTRTATLWVYVVDNVIVGFYVLAEAVSKSIKRGIELLMFSVATGQRGLGYGSAMLDGLVQTVTHHYFSLVARCPSDNQMLAAMLLSRGFGVMERHCLARVYHFLPPLFESEWAQQLTSSTRVE